MVLGLLNQLQIFSKLYLIELLGYLTGLRVLQLWHLKYPRFCHAGLLHKFKSYGISGQIFNLISSFLRNRWLRVVLDGKSSQEFLVNAGVPQWSILSPTLFLLYINDLFDDVVCDITIYADNTSLYSKCNQASDLCSNNLNWLLILNLIYETLWTGLRNGLLISMLGKLSWFCWTSLTTMVLLMWKWMCLFLKKNNLLRCWGWPSVLNCIGALTLPLLLKLPPRKLEL